MASPLPPEAAHVGNLRLLDEPLTAPFCSQRCPGDLILKTYDLARAMRDAGAPAQRSGGRARRRRSFNPTG